MSGVKVKLNSEEFKTALRAKLVSNMEIACKFVETEARTNLVAIEEPDWGAAYRREIVARRLTYVVTEDDKAIVGVVGVERGQSGEDHGYWIETGSKTAPPQPWLRPAVFHNAKTIVKLLTGE